MEKQNRAERRKNRFGGGRTSEHGGWPTSRLNPVFDAETPAGETLAGETPAGAPDQDHTVTGAGTRGATDQAGRAPRHEGTHASNSTKR